MNDELSMDPADLIGESPPGAQRLCHVGSVSGLYLAGSSHFYLGIWEVQLCQSQCYGVTGTGESPLVVWLWAVLAFRACSR